MSKKFKEGQKVKLVVENEIVVGTLKSVYDWSDNVIVELDDDPDHLVKCNVETLLPMDEEVHNESNESNDEIEKQISYDQFKKAVVDQMTMENLCLKYNVSFFQYHNHIQIGLALGAKMAAELFEEMDLTITITKSKLYETIDRVITLDLFSDECLPKDFSVKEHSLFTSIFKKMIDELFADHD